MRRLLLVALAVLALVAAAAAVAVGSRGDDRDSYDPPQRRRPRAAARASFAVERIATGFNRPDVGRHRARRPGRALGARAAGARRPPPGRAPPHVLDLSAPGAHRRGAGAARHRVPPRLRRRPAALPALERPRRRHAASPSSVEATRSTRPRCASCCTSSSRRRTTTAAQLAFGPDGRLYLGLGDGGGAFDPDERAQDPATGSASCCRSTSRPTRPDWRVALSGLRNPWRFSFDPALGEVWIGDVGQDDDRGGQPRPARARRAAEEPRLGRVRGHRRRPRRTTSRSTRAGELVWPVVTYTHDDGCSVTGGYVYQGTGLPRLRGRYLYGDFCSGVLWSLKGAPKGKAADVRRERAAVPQLTHIGPDADGEPLFASTNGAIYRATRPGR